MQVYRSVDVEVLHMTPDAFVKYLGTWYASPLSVFAPSDTALMTTHRPLFLFYRVQFADGKGISSQWAPACAPSDWVIVCPRSPVAIWRRKNPTAPDKLEELRVSGLPSAHDMTRRCSIQTRPVRVHGT